MNLRGVCRSCHLGSAHNGGEMPAAGEKKEERR